MSLSRATGQNLPDVKSLDNRLELAALLAKSPLDSEQRTALLGRFRAELYDYCIRMTGQQSRAQDSIDEVINALAPRINQYETWKQLRVVLFATLRSFNADIWNADTGHLSNLQIDSPAYQAQLKPQAMAMETVQNLEQRIRRLPPWEREPLLLSYRCHFTFAEIGMIMSNPIESIDSGLRSGMERLTRDLGLTADIVQKTILWLPAFAPMNTHAEPTHDLSEVIRGLRTPVSLWRSGIRRWMTMTIVATLVYVVYYFFVKSS